MTLTLPHYAEYAQTVYLAGTRQSYPTYKLYMGAAYASTGSQTVYNAGTGVTQQASSRDSRTHYALSAQGSSMNVSVISGPWYPSGSSIKKQGSSKTVYTRSTEEIEQTLYVRNSTEYYTPIGDEPTYQMFYHPVNMYDSYNLRGNEVTLSPATIATRRITALTVPTT